MTIQYIITDFELESTDDLHPVAQEIGAALAVQLDQWIDGIYRVSFSGNGAEIHGGPEQTISEFCDIVEGLSAASKALWHGCVKRVADMAFASGSEPKHMTYQLSAELIARLETQKMGIAVTIYPIGAYASEENEP